MLKELIANCWDPLPQKRPTFDELIRRLNECKREREREREEREREREKRERERERERENGKKNNK
jgi:hypothetical protein